ncbi:hypothetical protein, partial [Cobetia amphilecti]|uniref:hypothetical protein n=1 Tax=Cobetia amphilecti TaxID=1055104 RepID=UPI001AE08149
FSLLIKGTRSSINYSDAFLEQRCSPYRYISDEDLERLNKIREESINDAREIMNSHYLFMTESEVVIVKSLIEGLKFPDYLDSQEMAEQDLEHHSELLKEIEKSAKESLHIEQSNTYLLLSRSWKYIDKLLEPAVKKSQ